MTKFDPNATPECDANLRFVNSAGKTYVCLLLETGVELERRARVAEHELEQTKKKLGDAEEKLKIALNALDCCWPGPTGDIVRQHHDHARKEIERVGR